MVGYVDLSCIYSIIVSLTYIYFSRKILNLKLNYMECVSIVILNVILYFNAFIFSYIKFMNAVFILGYFLLVYRSKCIQRFLLYILVYYGAISYGLILDGNIYIYNFIVLLNNEMSFFYVFTSFINIVTIELILFAIKSIKLLANYKMNVVIEIDKKIYKVSGYMDSGNTLLKEELPVIFLNNAYLEKKASDKMIVRGMGVRECKYKKAKITLNNISKDVVCALVSNMSFKGCNCLLNIHLLKET